MAFRKVSAKSAPKRSRVSSSKFEKTNDWMLMQVALQKGFKFGEALELVLTDADKQRCGIRNRRTVARFIKKYLETNNLPYNLKSFHRDDMGDVFLVQHPPLSRR